ncbi:MAG: hypothetical protein PVF33_05565, partial [Candidatus Latescibacterota bacterium]
MVKRKKRTKPAFIFMRNLLPYSTLRDLTAGRRPWLGPGGKKIAHYSRARPAPRVAILYPQAVTGAPWPVFSPGAVVR